jgi:protein gp37
MLGAVDMKRYFYRYRSKVSGLLYSNPGAAGNHDVLPGIDWVICGGESGLNARPMHPEWVRSLRDQCTGAGVPFYFKQWGEWLHDSQTYDCKADLDPDWINHQSRHRWSDHTNDVSYLIGKRRAGRILDGKEYIEFPIHYVKEQSNELD